MKAPSRAVALLFAVLMLTFLACPAGEASHGNPPPWWRAVFVDRRTEIFRVGDQAAGSQNCVGWACRGALLGAPVHAAGTDLPSAGTIFDRARRYSVELSANIGIEHGAMALREMQAIQDYRMLYSSAAIWEWLYERGPVVAAVYWDALLSAHKGSLRAVPVNEGSTGEQSAHAITILGWSPSRKAFYFTPNLGRLWGKEGFAFIREDDLPVILINAAGLVHEGTDRDLLSGGSEGAPPREGRPGTSQSSSADLRHHLLEEALSRVEAVSRSLGKSRAGAGAAAALR